MDKKNSNQTSNYGEFLFDDDSSEKDQYNHNIKQEFLILPKDSKTKNSQSGFNLIEIMVAITIIGILMAIVGVNVLGALGDAKQDATKTTIGNIENALTMYKLDNGRYPSTSDGLQALISAPSNSKKPGKKYLNSDQVPKDNWDNDLLYYSPGTHGSHDYEVMSYGADNNEGGEGEDKDITSWDK